MDSHKTLIKKTRLLQISLLLILVAVFVNCRKKDGKKEEEPTAVFDKHAMLVNYSDNIILPCYKDLSAALDNLIQAFNTFLETGMLQDFQLTKQKLDVAYLKFQRVNLFGFGPGELQNVRSNFNIFPADTTKIKSNITNGNYDLNTAVNVDAKGFPALDFLFYGYNATEEAQRHLFVSGTARRQYTSNLLNDMRTRTNAVINSWNNEYTNSFVNSIGSDIGSSMGFLVNQLNYELDYLKNAKIATPLGLKSDGIPKPDNSEAFYAKQSMAYAIETFNTIENVFLGRSFSGTNGIGFDDYLNHLGARYGNDLLTVAINGRFASARAKLSAISDPLSDKVITETAKVNEAYKELVKLLVLLKTDMPSSLGVVITYQDGDGD